MKQTIAWNFKMYYVLFLGRNLGKKRKDVKNKEENQ